MNYLGIDLHKRTSTWVLLNEEREVLQKCEVPCHPENVAQALALLPVATRDIQAVLEPVSGWRWYLQQLEATGMNVAVANPLKTRLIQVRTGFKNRLKGVVASSGIHDILDTCLQTKGQEYIERYGSPELQHLQSIIKELNTYLGPMDKQIAEIAKTHETIKLLMSVPVIGPITGTTIVAEVGDFSRFTHPGALASYAGLVPSQRSSGEKQKYGRITKMGSSYLRHVLVESAMRLRSHHAPELYTFYERVRKEHSPMKARVALARKTAGSGMNSSLSSSA